MSDYGRWFKRDKLCMCSKTWVPSFLPTTANFLPIGNSCRGGPGNLSTYALCKQNPVSVSPSSFCFYHWYHVLHTICNLLFSLHLTWRRFCISSSRAAQLFSMGICISMNGQSTRLTQPLLVATHKELFFLNLQPELKLFHLILFKFCVALFSA